MMYRQNCGGWWRIHFGQTLPSAPPTQDDGLPVFVPSCWNELFPERSHYDGVAWYFREIGVAAPGGCTRWRLCFEGVSYCCEAFVNGQAVGRHEGGFTYFSFDVTDYVRPGHVNTLLLRVSGTLDDTTIPPAGVDWFNYGGVYRPVYLEATGSARIDDYAIRTRCDGSVSLRVRIDGGAARTLTVRIFDAVERPVAEAQGRILPTPDGTADIALQLSIPDARLWEIWRPYLYRLEAQLLLADGSVSDRVTKRFGLREFSVQDRRLLVNGREVRLVGCSKHEDYPLTGRVATREQLVRDYALLRGMNANFVRLAHYPHNAIEHELLNEIGMVSMAELPLVFLHGRHLTSQEMLDKAKRTLTEMIRFERNETNILFWSLFVECDTHLPESEEFVRALIAHARSLDDSRPLIMASIRPLDDLTYDFFDVVGLNYWEGWYHNAPLSQAEEWMATMAARFPHKPILVTSHGWEGLRGTRTADGCRYWSEDLQADYLGRAADVFMGQMNVIGEVVWTFSDFRVTPWRDSAHDDVERFRYQERPGEVNHKGIVDYYRRPKASYEVIKQKFAEWQENVRPHPDSSGRLRIHRCSSELRAAAVAGSHAIEALDAGLRAAPTVALLLDLGRGMTSFLEGLARNRMFLAWERVLVLPAGCIWSETADWQAILGTVRRRLPEARLPEVPGPWADARAFAAAYARILDTTEVTVACLALGSEGALGPALRPAGGTPLNAGTSVVPAATVPSFVLEELDCPTTGSACVVSVTQAILGNAGRLICLATGAKCAAALRNVVAPDAGETVAGSVLRAHHRATVYADPTALALVPAG